ncbi:MAG TPA: PQQ-binding-like beta-propeller repeat protein [Candidatus Acidoferrum sp.]|jgi:polyvinyl alcohol dehydrogenase (cytochrome)|nr:PQQ-binding-like beta-propeller repeat protein [Candidatus Acidoferrum sp.]
MKRAIAFTTLRFPILMFVGLVCAIQTSAAQNTAPASPTAPPTISGADVYQKRCASCHDQAGSRAPSRDALQKLSAARILRTLDFGLMMAVAYPINRAEREAVANFLGTKAEESPLPASAFCAANISIMSGPANDTWAGWSPSASNARYQAAERAGLAPGQVRRLKLKWALGFPDDVTAFAAPSVLNGTLFVGSASGAVEAVDAKTGCTHWVFQANGPVRAAILPVPNDSGTTLVVTDLIGWAYALDARSGHLIWKKRIDEHEATRLTGSSATLNGVVFIPAASWEETRSLDPQYVCCTFRGSITALRVRDGSVVWKTYTVDPPQKTGTNSVGVTQWGPSGAPVWSAPTVDTKRGWLYVSTGDNYSVPPTTTSDAVMALDLKTGRIAWSSQVLANDAYTSACRTKGVNCPSTNGPDFDFGSSAILVRAPNGKEMLVAGQKSGMVYAFDPDAKGKILWQTRVGKGGLNGGVQWGMASDEQKVYAAVNDTSGVMNTAGPVGGATFDPVKGGGLTALHLEDGSKAWFAPSHPCDPPRPGCSPGQSAALTLIPGVVFSASLDGHVRAFSTEDGEMLWDFDTTGQTYSTVNGVPAKGGSIDGAGPVIAGGMMFVNSGYPRNGGMPGNVLLAFAPEDSK